VPRFFLLTLIGFTTAFAQGGPKAPPGLEIPPFHVPLDLDGQPLSITAWGEMSSVSSASPGLFRITLTGDFSDLQKNLTPLLSSQLNRSDKCGERLTIQQASLAPAPPSGILTANLHYERWACAKVLGERVVKRLVGGDGVVEVRLTPSVDAQGISMASEVQNIQADGSLGELLRSGSLGTSVREKIGASIQKAIRKATNFQSLLPPSLKSAVALRSVQFADGGSGKIWLSVRGEAQIPAEQLQLLTSYLKSAK
jgi:hypothetical protein